MPLLLLKSTSGRVFQITRRSHQVRVASGEMNSMSPLLVIKVEEESGWFIVTTEIGQIKIPTIRLSDLPFGAQMPQPVFISNDKQTPEQLIHYSVTDSDWQSLQHRAPSVIAARAGFVQGDTTRSIK